MKKQQWQQKKNESSLIEMRFCLFDLDTDLSDIGAFISVLSSIYVFFLATV